MYAAKIKNAAVWALAFTGFTVAFSGAYGAWNSSMSSTSSGSLLSAANWNAIVDNVLDLKSRTDSLSGTVSSLQTQVTSGTAGKYHLEATKATVTSTVPVDMSIVNALCKDGDGCDITVGMKDWDNAQVGDRVLILDDSGAVVADAEGTKREVADAVWDAVAVSR